MSAKHSPGPWVLEDIGDDRWRLADNDDNYIEFIHRSRYVDNRHDPVQEANARLIAAAPDMLALLKVLDEDALTGGLCQSIPSGVLRDLRAAIAKAEGR